ncbi:MAG: carotenoid oxygenase family protein, partial [Halieaceae bacterium]
VLDDLPCEFPRTDDRYMTRSHRHAYAVGGEGSALVFNRLLHYDTKTGSRKTWGDDKYLLGEPILAPRSDDAEEGDGYLLTLAYDQTTCLNEMMIFNADDIETGPIGRAKLPVRIPAGFHGSWVGA